MVRFSGRLLLGILVVLLLVPAAPFPLLTLQPAAAEDHIALQSTATAEPPGDPQSDPTANPEEILSAVVIWWPADLMPEIDTPAYDTLQDQFENFTAATGIAVQFRPKRLIGTGGIMSTLRTANPVAPAALPDLVLIPRESLRLAAETGLIYPLDDLIPIPVLDALYPSAVQLGQTNDATFGIPYALNVQHAIYRTSAFPTPPLSTADVLAAEQPFVIAGGVESGVNDVLLVQYLAEGGRLTGEDGRAILDEAALLPPLTFYEAARDNTLITPDVLDYYTIDDYWDQFLRGTVSLAQIDSDTYLATQEQLTSTAVISIGSSNERAGTTLRGWLWAITTPDPDRQAQVVTTLEWLMQPENHAVITAAFHVLPSQETAWHLVDQPRDYTQLIDDLLSVETLISREEVNTATAAALQEALAAVLTGDKSAVQAAADAAALFQE